MANRTGFGVRVFSTGQLAKLFGVAPRTVTKWCDTGALPHYRIPCSQDRRVKLRHLRDFAAKNNLPVDWDDHRILIVGAVKCYVDETRKVVTKATDTETTIVHDGFSAGAELSTKAYGLVVVETSGFLREALVIAERALGKCGSRCVVAILPEDATELQARSLRSVGCRTILKRPYDPGFLGEIIQEELK